MHTIKVSINVFSIHLARLKPLQRLLKQVPGIALVFIRALF